MKTLPTPEIEPGHLFCFGLGYTAMRLARRLIDAGWRVSGTSRSQDGVDQIRSAGISAYLFDGDSPMSEGAAAFDGVTHVVNSIPPSDASDSPLIHHAADMRSCPTLAWAAYLSTPAVYGDRQGALVHEDDQPNPGSARGERRLAAERSWLSAFDENISVQVFRLAGIYGPGRNVIKQLREGTARIIDKPGQVFNRIHVDDIGSILMASMARPNDGRIYNVCDNEACASGDVVRYGAGLIGADAPVPIPIDSAELSAMAKSFYAECKRLDNSRLADELKVELSYPTYREGLDEIAADLA